MSRRPYAPRGKIVPLLAAMKADPQRIWTVPEAAAVLNLPKWELMPMVAYALENEAMFRGRNDAGAVVLRGMPFGAAVVPAPPPAATEFCPDSDIRIPRVVPGWTPPKMVSARHAR